MGEEDDGPDRLEEREDRVVDRQPLLPPLQHPRGAQQADELDQAQDAEDAEDLELPEAAGALAEHVLHELEAHKVEGGDEDRREVDDEPRLQVVLDNEVLLCDPLRAALRDVLRLNLDHQVALDEHVEGEDGVDGAVDHKEGLERTRRALQQGHLRRRDERRVD